MGAKDLMKKEVLRDVFRQLLELPTIVNPTVFWECYGFDYAFFAQSQFN